MEKYKYYLHPEPLTGVPEYHGCCRIVKTQSGNHVPGELTTLGQRLPQASTREGPPVDDLMLPGEIARGRPPYPSRMLLRSETRDGPIQKSLLRTENQYISYLYPAVIPAGSFYGVGMALFRCRKTLRKNCLHGAGVALPCPVDNGRVPRDETERMPRDGIIKPAGCNLISYNSLVTELFRDNEFIVNYHFRWRKTSEVNRLSHPALGEYARMKW